MNDGGVNIDVGLNISKAEKDLQKLKDKIAKAEDQLNSDIGKHNAIEEKLNDATKAAGITQQKIKETKQAIEDMEKALRGDPDAISYDPQTFQGLSEDIKQAQKDLSDQEKILKEQTKEVNATQKEFERLSERVELGTKDLEDMKDKAGDMQREIARAKPGEAIARSMNIAKKSMMQFLKYSLGIRSVFFLFRRLRSAIRDAVSEFAENDEETKNTIQGLKNSLEQLKVSWGAAFAPILNAVAPLLQRLIGWLTSAANTVAKFIALISGRPSYKKAVANNNNLAASYDGVAESAKEAEKQIMGFDEINKLSDSGLSGAGGAGNAGTPSSYSMVEETLDIYDGSFLSNLALAVKDVLFDWSALNPEQIAQKAISGLGMLLGAGTGFLIGGVPGAIVGTLLGLGLTLVANSAIFDHDGVLSPDELASTLEIALNALVGGAIGFTVGGPGGALIGATIGTGITLLAKTILPKLGAGSTANLIRDLVDALGFGGVGGMAAGFALGGPGGALIGMTLGTGISLLAKKVLPTLGAGSTTDLLSTLVMALSEGGLAGAGVGFMLGGPGGALIGLVIGTGLSFVLKKIEAYNAEENGPEKYKDKVSWFLCGVLGMPTDEEFKGYGNDAIGWFLEGFDGFLDELHNIIGGPLETFIEEDIPETIEFFKRLGPKAFRWLGEGFDGFLDELHNIIGGPLETLIEEEIPATVEWLKELGPKAVSWIEEGLNDFGTQLHNIFVKPFEDMWNGLKTWWDGLSLAPFHIPRPVIEWGSRAVEGGLARVLDFFGLPAAMPTLSIRWAARGGILDGATLIGAGEAGKEALIPLERNTEWIKIVADGILDRLAKSDFANQLAGAFSSVPMPAMAGGVIAPPNAISGGTYGSGTLMEEIRALRGEISAIANQPIEVRSNLYMDKRKVGESVTEYQRTNGRAKGT